jgi:hypothetical protein
VPLRHSPPSPRQVRPSSPARCTSSTPTERQSAGGPAKDGKKADTNSEEADIRAALDQLAPEDRKLAEAQKFCAIEEENRLGSMGKPIKLVLKDQPVFLCCKGCKMKAERDPDKTLAKVKELRAKAGGVAEH